MSLTNNQIDTLAKNMGYAITDIIFKDELMFMKPEFNKKNYCCYVINMEDEYDDKGRPNEGSHWVALYIKKMPDGKIQPIYFDSYGVAPPKSVTDFVGTPPVPYNTKFIQGMLSVICGWFCLAFLYMLTSFPHRTGDTYVDASNFLDLFEDLSNVVDMHKNEWILKHFFQDTTEGAVRKAIEPNLHHVTDLSEAERESLGKTKI
jgi:hypothetical protein